MRKLIALTIFAGLMAATSFSQQSQETKPQPPPPKFADPQAMPADRESESYDIYSLLLTGGPIEWRNAKRSQWLIQDTTTANALDVPCHPENQRFSTDPFNAIKPPEDRLAEWKEVLDDYEQHCHDVVRLEAGRFPVVLPIRLLDAAARKRYQERKNDNSPGSEFYDTAGLHSFSEVYFNQRHTLAMVHQGMYCGMLCGNWQWVVLERTSKGWKQLPWVRVVTFS